MHILNIILRNREQPVQLHFNSAEEVTDVKLSIFNMLKRLDTLNFNDEYGKCIICRSDDVLALYQTSTEQELELQALFMLAQAKKQQEMQARAPRIVPVN